MHTLNTMNCVEAEEESRCLVEKKALAATISVRIVSGRATDQHGIENPTGTRTHSATMKNARVVAT